jgi:hypothetical protein
MMDIDVTIVLVALATTCTIVMIGLGFLPYPSRASVIWSAGFATVMVCSYLLVAADATGTSILRAIAHGPTLCAIGFLWVGLRARRGRDDVHLFPTIGVFSVLTIALALTAETDWYGIVLRLAFAVGGVASALVASELLRIKKPLREMTTPLIVAALGFAVLSAVLLFDGISRVAQGTWQQGEVDMLALRTLNELAASLYLVCALVTVLALTRAGDTPATTHQITDFRLIATDRLGRAKAAGDRWWSLLDIRLDDPVELLEASSARAFDRVTSRFTDDIRAVMPPEADIHIVSPTRHVILVPRSDTSVRALMSQLLEKVATVTDTQAVPVRLSASIGVAAAPIADYDLDRLSEAAAQAASHAQLAGGDRWERAIFAE